MQTNIREVNKVLEKRPAELFSNFAMSKENDFREFKSRKRPVDSQADCI